MPIDIFISYSRQDSAQALTLAEKLRSAGMEVWIDQHGIEAATSWSKEIVSAIEECQAFCILLSDFSLASNNVVKELALAGEFKRTIVPIELHTLKLTNDFHYQLAGLQRVAITDLEAILRALKKLGIATAESPLSTEHLTLSTSKDTRKSLIILPFEDLSPSQDNQWFADGLAGEFIDALGHIKSLRILDRKTSLQLRGVKQSIVEIGKLFDTRYFIEGTVRKFGDQIKISVSLLDIETGDHVWQESHRGEFKDIFDIQEAVAQKVVEGLKLHLTKEEKSLLVERGTENAEAYELLVQAGEYHRQQSIEGFRHSLQLIDEAIHIDPNYARAYLSKANTLASLCRIYNPDPALLVKAEALCAEALRLKPEWTLAYQPLSKIALLQGKHAEAEQIAKKYILKEPHSSNTHDLLGFFYFETGRFSEAIAPLEEAARLNPNAELFNLLGACDGAGETKKCAYWAAAGLPIVERYLKLHPDSDTTRVEYAFMLFWSGNIKAASAAAITLMNVKDGRSLYNTACLFGRLGDKLEALHTFRKAVESGFKYIRLLKDFLTDDKEGILSLAGSPEYEIVKKMVEKVELEQLADSNTEVAVAHV